MGPVADGVTGAPWHRFRALLFHPCALRGIDVVAAYSRTQRSQRDSASLFGDGPVAGDVRRHTLLTRTQHIRKALNVRAPDAAHLDTEVSLDDIARLNEPRRRVRVSAVA